MIDRARNLVVNVYVVEPEARNELLVVEGAATTMFGQPRDVQRLTVQVQGRECEAIAFSSVVGEGLAESFGGAEGKVLGPGMRFDVSGTDQDRAVLVELRRVGSEDAIGPELPEEILEPFDVWALR